MNTITLYVQGLPSFSFEIHDEPHCEKDLLQYPQYVKWFWKTGLDAPVKANVTVKKSLFKKTEYSFEYTIKGNSMTFSSFEDLLARYKSYSVCANMNVVMDQGIYQYILLFDDKDKAMQMCKDLDNICNIGSYGFYNTEQKKYVVQIEYHMVG